MFKKMQYFSLKVKVTKVNKNIRLAALGIFLICLGGCTMTRTPEIRGLVLDRETWKPVPDAWIHAQLGLELVTIAGRGNDLLSLDSPHTRTNEKGEFFIPARDFQSPFFPFILKKNYYYFGVSAETLDDRLGEYDIGPWGWKSRIDVTLYMEPWKEFLQKNREKGSSYIGDFFLNYSGADNPRNPLNFEEAYYSYLQTLEHYCFGGRLHYEKPPVKEGCDEWELSYAIYKHNIFLKRIDMPKTMHQRVIFGETMRQLAYLYKRNKNYEKAVEMFKAALIFDKERNVKLNIVEYENQIKELKQLIQNEKK